MYTCVKHFFRDFSQRMCVCTFHDNPPLSLWASEMLNELKGKVTLRIMHKKYLSKQILQTRHHEGCNKRVWVKENLHHNSVFSNIR